MLKRAISALVFVACLPARTFAQPPVLAGSAVSYDRLASWRYTSEQEWIVGDVVATLAALADRQRPTRLGDVRVTTLPASGAFPRFLVDASGAQTTIEIHDHIWAAANYLPLLKKWVPARPHATSNASPSGVLSALTTPRIEVLVASNQEIGRRLAAKAPARGDYEDAALLTGVMALREGEYAGDVRPFLSKMTAYLVMAGALGGSPTPSGRVADVLQLALVERQRDALGRLEKWEAASPSALDRAWILALRMRITGDWRVLQRPREASLLERLEYARALALRRGQSALLDFLDDSHPEDIADWTRIAEVGGMSVESANRFGEDAVRGDLRDAAYVWEHVSPPAPGAKLDLPALIDALNDGAAADKNLALDWPTWASSFERHLARHIEIMVTRESRTFGRPDKARSEAKDLEEAFGRLTLFPVAKLHYALDDGQYVDAMKGVIGLMRGRPERLTTDDWMAALEWRNGRTPSGITPQSVWFTTLVPEGTAQGADDRVYTYRRTNHLTQPALEALRQVAPYSRYLLEEEMRWRYKRPLVPPLDEYKREAGVLADYDGLVLADLAASAEADPAAYVPLAERLCNLEVSSCKSLAGYLADHERDEEAARVYRRWIDSDRDTVGVANGSSWLITYYYAHGQREAAVELANKAAEAFSFRGLTAKARLLERMGDYPGAEALQKQASDRYNRTDALGPFYLRWAKASGDPGARNAGDTLVARVFPQGLEPFPSTASLAPRDGVRITEAGAIGVKAGFAIGDVIVAVDGIAVHNNDQFVMARQLDMKPEIAFTVWKGGKYIAVQGALRESWISGTFVTYRAAEAR